MPASAGRCGNIRRGSDSRGGANLAHARGMDQELERAILELLAERRGSICPSDAARRVGGEDGAWRKLMEPARRAARRLAADSRVIITQRGELVGPEPTRGPIRIARGPAFDEAEDRNSAR